MCDWKGILAELLNDESDTMTTWEVEFIESINRQRYKNRVWEPNEKQTAILAKIWQRVFGE